MLSMLLVSLQLSFPYYGSNIVMAISLDIFMYIILFIANLLSTSFIYQT